MNRLFWNKKQKKNKDMINSKEAAMMLKSAANMLLQDFTKTINPVEIVLINALVTYMDTFVLKCFVKGKLKHTTWILARLLEIRTVLQATRSREVKALVNMVSALETLIMTEKVNNG